MKKLGKFKLDPDKVMKYEELITLKGGYSGYDCHINCDDGAFWEEGMPGGTCTEASDIRQAWYDVYQHERNCYVNCCY